MADQQHPITPPPELVREWSKGCSPYDVPADHIATQAARWGADAELEACCALIGSAYVRDRVRAARRPKPPSVASVAEEAQRILVENGRTLDGRVELDPEDVVIISAALKRLQELENNG